MALDLCSIGSVDQTHTIKNASFESRSFTAEEANLIARETFGKAVILRNTVLPLEGEEVIDAPAPFVTFHEDVMNKQRLKRDTIRAEVQSEATTGKGVTACGFWPVEMNTNQEAEAIVTREAWIHSSTCVKELLPTYLGKAMKRAKDNDWESPNYSLELEYAHLKACYKSWDTHSFMGDYGSGNKNFTHTDGFIKDVVLSMGSVQNSIAKWTFAGVASGTCIEYMIGGYKGSVAWDTDVATTLANVATDIGTTQAARFLDQNQVSIIEAVTSGSNFVTIEMAQGFDALPQIRFVITNCDGFTICDDFSLQATTAVSGASVTVTRVQELLTGQQPISFTYENITPSNVSAKLAGMYEEINLKKPDLLQDPNFTLFLAPNVTSSLKIANQSANTMVGKQMEEITTIWDGTRVQTLHGGMLPQNFIFGASSESLHAASYMFGDTNTIMTEYDAFKELYKHKHNWHMGFKTTRRDEIVGTFTDPSGTSFMSNFGARQPEMF